MLEQVEHPLTIFVEDKKKMALRRESKGDEEPPSPGLVPDCT